MNLASNFILNNRKIDVFFFSVLYMCNRYEILKLVALDFLKSENFCLKFYATLFFIATILLCCKTKLSPVYDENVGLCLQITNR